MKDSEYILSIYNPIWIFILLFIWDITILRYRKVIINTHKYIHLIKKSNNHTLIFLFIATFICVFGIHDGDWFGYINMFQYTIKHPLAKYNHLEPVYVWITNNLTLNYYLIFRTIIWGGAMLFYYWGFKRLGINNVVTWISLILTTLYSIAYTRTTLGLGILFCGYCFVIKANKIPYRYIIGFFLILTSVLFHRSMYIVVFCALASLLPSKKWIYLSTILSFPIILALFSIIVGQYMTSDTEGVGYVKRSYIASGPGAMIYDILSYIYIFMTYIYLLRKFLKDSLPKEIKKFFFFITYCIIMWLIFYIYFILGGVGGKYLSRRLFQFVFTGFPVLFTYVMFSCKKKTFKNVLFLVSFVTLNYILCYNYYIQSLNY